VGAELQWSQWTKVRSGANLFNAVGFAPCNGKDKWDGCTTKNYVGTSLAFTPTWYQVFPGVDLSAPMSYAGRPQRQCRHRLRRQRGAGQLPASACPADVQQKYRFDLKYIDYGRPLQGQRHGSGHCDQRADHLPEGPWIRQPDFQEPPSEARP
jgi:hypothetical protein